MGGKTNCGVLSYAYVDAEMADYVVAVTDCLVDYPNYPAEINQTKVDYVCVVDQIGIPEKIATGAAKPTTDQRKLLMAEYCTQVVANTPYFKDGFSYQTGVGGASIASTISLSKIMEEKNIHMGLGVGGLTKPMCELLDRGLARKLVDTQDFDLDAVNNVRTNPNHFPISAGEYASPMNKAPSSTSWITSSWPPWRLIPTSTATSSSAPMASSPAHRAAIPIPHRVQSVPSSSLLCCRAASRLSAPT